MTVRDATPGSSAAQDQDEDRHRLTALEGLAALSLDALSSIAYGPEAIVIVLTAAGTVGLGYGDPEFRERDARFHEQWAAWHPGLPPVSLYPPNRSLGPSVVDYVRAREQEDPHRRVVVLIPEVQPEHWWRWFLHNQRGAVLNRAITSGTENVVICRLRFRLAHLAPDEEPGSVSAEGHYPA